MEAGQVETTYFPIIGAALIAIAAIVLFIYESKMTIPAIAAAIAVSGTIVLLVHEFVVFLQP
jgi:cobalamin synthase